ncbi:MAG: aminotransferase class III-fold pyridoxal phosphate-dependent enzyme, partial [Nitrospira sp.]|nr:aminotransferase class III-fold pyridoxal phosphate-dependent enzyme [Nitrospira sp.]
PKIRALTTLLKPLARMAHVGDIRQVGLVAGIELVVDRATKEPYPIEARIGHRVTAETRRNGLLLRPLGNVLLLLPPLSVSLPELKRMVSILQSAIQSVTE